MIDYFYQNNELISDTLINAVSLNVVAIGEEVNKVIEP